MICKFESACTSFIGHFRENNEDNFYFNKKHLPEQNRGLDKILEYKDTTADNRIFAVFDGLGGEAHGEKAAFIACETFAEEIKQLEELAVTGMEFFRTACKKASTAIIDGVSKDNTYSSGTTVAALMLYGDEVVACNVGDSRIYRLRDKELSLISLEHTDERILLSMGIDKKPVLLQYLGLNDDGIKIEPYITKGKLCQGDVLIVCTDGVSDALTPDELYTAVAGKSAYDAVDCIIKTVDEKHGSDNATVAVVRIS